MDNTTRRDCLSGIRKKNIIIIIIEINAKSHKLVAFAHFLPPSQIHHYKKKFLVEKGKTREEEKKKKSFSSKKFSAREIT